MCHFSTTLGIFAYFWACTYRVLYTKTAAKPPSTPISHHNTYTNTRKLWPKHPKKHPQYLIYDIFLPTPETKCNENAGEMKITPQILYHI